MPSDPRYQLERVEGDEPLARVQENIQRVFEQVSGDRDTNETAASAAATASGTSYTPARTADWAGTAPATLQDAADRIAYHIASGGGTAPILELP